MQTENIIQNILLLPLGGVQIEINDCQSSQLNLDSHGFSSSFCKSVKECRNNLRGNCGLYE